MRIFSACFRMIAWPYCHSEKPWSYGMRCYCRDPKTQKWCRWLALRGWPLEVKAVSGTCYHVSEGRYGLQLHIESFSIWIARLDLEVIATDKSVGTYIGHGPYRGGIDLVPSLWLEDIISRDPDMTFTWKLFLLLAEVHILLVVHAKPFRRWSLPRNGHPRKAKHHTILGFWVPTITTHAITPWF
jgi:hypothetical protein